MNKLFAALGMLTLTSIAIAQTQVPNKFQSGQPARAAEVNANFDAVEAGITSNSTAISANADAIRSVEANISSNSSTISRNTIAIQSLEASVDSNAAVVSDNFTAIQSNRADIQANSQAISALANGIPVFLDGSSIGSLIAIDAKHSSTGDYWTTYWVLSRQGYVFRATTSKFGLGYLDPASNIDYAHIYFATPDCTGAGYIDSQLLDPWAAEAGTVVSAFDASLSPAFYTTRGTKSLTVTVQSVYTDACRTTNYTGQFYEAFPNDEAITGVSNSSPLGALTIGVP